MRIPLPTLCLLLAVPTASLAEAPAPLLRGPGPGPGLDPHRVVGPDDCGDCHENEYEVWRGTAHARGYVELARSQGAKAIADALGVRRIRVEPSCVGCHFLAMPVGDGVQARFGVACESCHGASAAWIDVHSDQGEGDAEETPEHRRERLARSSALGLRGPADLHGLLSTCFSCHVIDDPHLVEVGGHPMPPPFDLVAATQGDIRHNFLRGRGENAAAPPAHRRTLQAMGRLLDLAWSLRALARADGAGAFATAAAQRVRMTRQAVADLAADGGPESLTRALVATESLDLAPGSPDSLMDAALVADGVARDLAHRSGDSRGDVPGAGPGVGAAGR